jgi:acyl dehydratase
MAQPKKLYLDAVHARDELAPLVKPPVDRVQLARYAGATGDFNPIFIDEIYAKSSGMPSVHAPGLMALGYLGQLVTDWARGGRVVKIGGRFLKLIWPGDVITAKGFVRERRGENGRYTAELDLSCENQKGERVVRGWATVQLFYNADDEARQRRGEPPFIVEVKDEPPEDRAKKGKSVKGKKAEPPKKAPAKVAARSAKRPSPKRPKLKARRR